MTIKEEAKKEVIAICASHKDEPSPLMVILEEIQKKLGYIPLEVQEVVSKEMGIPVAEIYGVVTFYNFFSLTPKGKYVVGVCLGTACYVKNSQQIIDKFAQSLGIEIGGTTEDGLFTVDAVRCIGACALAPSVSINGRVYAKVTPTEVDKIIADLRKKEETANG
ncbi:MAG: NAD(P)H-dependent oxidoreductase subunit E [Bacilli bacterium]|nr:NAD(P)H-dependent oxidoreductase subunit E [Bacilli bacterium]